VRGVRRLAVAVRIARIPGVRHAAFPRRAADEMLGLAGVARYQHLLAFFADAEKEGLVTPYFRERAGRSAPPDYLDARFRAPRGDILNRYLYLDLTTYLPEDILLRSTSPAWPTRFECRSPSSIQADRIRPRAFPEYSFRRRATQAILKGPSPIGCRGGFMGPAQERAFPCRLSRWLKDDLADMMRDTLVSRKTLSRGFARTWSSATS